VRLTDAANLSFVFPDVLPGPHTLSVVSPSFWCWDTASLAVSAPVSAPLLVRHTGFKLRNVCGNTPPALAATRFAVGEKEASLECGAEMCVSENVWQKALLRIAPVSCLRFEPPEVTADGMTEAILSFAPAAWRVSGRVENGTAKLFFANGLPIAVSREGTFACEVALGERSEVRCQPEAPEQLSFPAAHVFPANLSLCPAPLTFLLRSGHFIRGKITPPTAGVRMQVACRDAASGGAEQEKISEAESGAEGFFSLGPLRGACGSVSGTLPGHAVVPEKTESSLVVFSVSALAELRVALNDRSGRGVSEAVLSLSGPDSFRENTLSGSDGTFVFSNLAPGEYFLRPLLKVRRLLSSRCCL
jgi:hypothetical protein